ncbi:UbiA family prenyltransferase [Jeotgalibaca caeni]|uniref:UbiA family prenyltransferase n=1 Tax=Jeotgalibaca caeni TaxID=3028623 RepID=UPI00237E968F|nr:UbiA family prenyltransferase [Jeotgalibaca caeni]MDE1549441.1 UbiA family prenyltransferase [Jeotgalibaca caeni]
MLHRIAVYLKEMYPIIPRLIVSLLLVAVQYFGVLAFAETKLTYEFSWADLGVVYTVFAFLMLLRIADEFKDLKKDLINYPDRPLPSGRVSKKDLWTLGAVVGAVMVVVNLFLPQSIVPFLVLLFYGFLMTVWFFQRDKIEPSLVLALVTHNPVQLIMSYYVIHYVANRYDLPIWTWENVCLAFAIYIPALLWEISRKIKAPVDENQYVTYSQVWGFRGSIFVVLGVAAVGLFFMMALVLRQAGSFLLVLAYGGLLYALYRFYRNPAGKNLKGIVPNYLFVSLGIFLVLIGLVYWR